VSSCSIRGDFIVCKLRGLVEGEAEGEALVVRGPLSFYGEVDPSRCRLLDGRPLGKSTILIFRESRGSTVAPYIIYSLRAKGCGPAGMVVVNAEPMLVAGAVIANIPLASGLAEQLLAKIRDGSQVKLVSNPPHALLEVQIKNQNTH
jgi:predicted aconitase with swiveling domain